MKALRTLVNIFITLAVLAIPAGVHAQSTTAQNFTISSFNADYYLGRDGEKRSTLRVEETITAQFPQSNQNHGIERAIPETYDGHSIELAITSVTNEGQVDLPYTTYTSNGNRVLRIGDPDVYVHGAQTYVIRYTAHDVTKQFDDHDEFFWDVNGTEWSQQFGAVTAQVHLDKDIADAYADKLRCYVGKAGSTTTSDCTIAVRQTFAPTDDVVIDARVKRLLQSRENLSVVVGLQAGTFAAYKPTAVTSAFGSLLAAWLVINVVVLFVMTAVLVRYWRRYGRQPEGSGSTVPQYLPPKELSVISSATILKKQPRAITAQIIDLCVRHYCKIYETKKKRFFGTNTEYDIELIKDPHTLRAEEKEVVTMLFGTAGVGARVALKSLSSKLYQQAGKTLKANRTMLVQSAYIAERSRIRRQLYWIGGALMILAICTVTPVTFIAGIVAFVLASSMWPLTTKGVASYEYLQGLHHYMKLAETDRIRELQSPQGAAKTPVDTDDAGVLVHLYERILPYAVLFGIEKEWAKQFAELYQQPPEWYNGNWAAFNAVVFASSISRFNTVAASSFAAPTDSSSSGFSSGGSSGGGGGGGGGGGW